MCFLKEIGISEHLVLRKSEKIVRIEKCFHKRHLSITFSLKYVLLPTKLNWEIHFCIRHATLRKVHFEKVCLSHIKENSWFVEQLGRCVVGFLFLYWSCPSLLESNNSIVQCRKFATLSEHNLQSLPRAITEMRLSSYPTWQANGLCEYEPLESPLCLSFWQGVALTTYFRFNYREWGNGIVGKALDVKGVTKVPWGVYQRDLIYRKWIFHFNTQCLKIIHKKVSWRNVTRLPNIVWWRLCTEFHDFLFKKWDQFNNFWL